MSIKIPQVTLLTHTPHPEQIIATAAKMCYAKSDALTVFENNKDEKAEDFIQQLLIMGHESPLEHVSFTFAFTGVSRALLAQLTRHRIASYSVQSQRYVSKHTPSYIVPTDIKNNQKAMDIYCEHMQKTWDTYNLIADELFLQYTENGMESKSADKKAIENARYVLPNACDTQLIVTMNARSLLNFFDKRCCNRAQDEIREVADEMLRLVREVCPSVFQKAGAPCSYGKCPEGKMSCGNARR